MKEDAKKILPLLLVMALVSAVCLLFSVRKSGMFIDEIYTYGLSNSHYAPYLTDVQGGSFTDTVMTRQQLLDYVSVGDDDRFDFGSVYYNQTRDVHPPLYYWLFNMVSSLTPHSFSKWTGLALDYVIYMLALFLLYQLARTLGAGRPTAAACAGIYGLSGMGLSTMLMIRMYVLMTALTLLLALLVARLMQERKRRYYPLIGLTLFLGLMTQYYFVFYAFFLCAAYVFWALAHREFKSLGLFCLFAFAGVGALLLAFPACLDQLFADALVSGGSAVDNLRDFSQYPTRLITFASEMRHGLKAALLIAFGAAVVLLIFLRRLLKAGICWRWLWIVLPAVPTFVLVALISPVLDQRYVYNLAPVFVLAAGMLLDGACRLTGDKQPWAAPILCLAVLVFALQVAHYNAPQYLYPEYREYDALVAQHAQAPCVYMTDDYFAPVTEDLLQLLAFEDFFVTGDADSPALDAYLEQADARECVVYIDTSVFWSSGFDPDQMLPELLASTEYTDYAPLYANGLSETYLLTK